MHRIGQVLHVSKTKNLILKAENIPRIGDKVSNEKLKSVGTVFDVFGPTSSPYVAVKPHIQSTKQFVNQILYVVPSKKEQKRGK
ncbi:H/ACA ribonucleoprotein complex subunit GAR1 [Thermoproteota archaeon]